jgi:hypothetical protein
MDNLIVDAGSLHQSNLGCFILFSSTGALGIAGG